VALLNALSAVQETHSQKHSPLLIGTGSLKSMPAQQVAKSRTFTLSSATGPTDQQVSRAAQLSLCS
jgi:hypothetical protein